jgi:hypothetical protein
MTLFIDNDFIHNINVIGFALSVAKMIVIVWFCVLI